MNLSLNRVYIKKGQFEIKYISENNRYCIVDDVDAISSLHRHIVQFSRNRRHLRHCNGIFFTLTLTRLSNDVKTLRQY